MDRYKVTVYNINDDLTEEIGEGLDRDQVDAMIFGSVIVGIYEDPKKKTKTTWHLDDVSKIMYMVTREA